MKRLFVSVSVLLLSAFLFAQASENVPAHQSALAPENAPVPQNAPVMENDPVAASAADPVSGYRIERVEYSITGKTKESQLRRKVQPDTSRIFNTEAELDDYISKLLQQYTNLRLFDEVDIQKTTDETVECVADVMENARGIRRIILTVHLKDTRHLLFLPYPKYSSNDGFTAKLKLKDDNFLGTISPLECEGKINYDSGAWKFGLGAEYAFPFSAGPFNFKWNNAHNLLFTIGEAVPSFDLNTGITAELPFKHFSLAAGFMQSVVRGDDEHKLFGNSLYYNEWGEFSVPVIFNLPFVRSPLTFEPYTSVTYLWSNENLTFKDEETGFEDTEMYSPVYGGGFRLAYKDTDWIGNFRNGLEFTADGNFSWDFCRSLPVPYAELNVKAFKAFEKIALAANLNVFARKDRTETIGELLRGVPDTPEVSSKKSCRQSSFCSCSLSSESGYAGPPFQFHSKS